VYAKATETVTGFKKILTWEVDHIPENMFLYKENMDAVVAKYEKSLEEEK
jgi:F0F1-type ATP synthase beta subunit